MRIHIGPPFCQKRPIHPLNCTITGQGQDIRAEGTVLPISDWQGRAACVAFCSRGVFGFMAPLDPCQSQCTGGGNRPEVAGCAWYAWEKEGHQVTRQTYGTELEDAEVSKQLETRCFQEFFFAYVHLVIGSS